MANHKRLFEINRGNLKAIIFGIDEELKVVFYKNNKILPESTSYYTNDLDDAKATADMELKFMEKRNEKK